MTTPEAALAHIVSWDIEFNRPIVDNKVAHPITGEIREPGSQGSTYGPPGIEVRFLSTNTEERLPKYTKTVYVSVEKVFLAVARHLHDGIYKPVNINVSAYSFTIVAFVRVSAEELDVAWKNMFMPRAEFRLTDADWDDYFRKRIEFDGSVKYKT